MEIKRDLELNKLIQRRHNGSIKVITGLRRCGKSYLLFHLFNDWLIQNGTNPDHIIKVDLENRRNKALRDPDALIAHIDAKMKDDAMYYIFIDEVQHVAEFSDVLNSYLSVENADVYVTGSNAKFLSSDILTEFGGRGDEVRIHPLSIREVWTVYPEMSKEDLLEEYMVYGGLPHTVTQPTATQKRAYLKTLLKKTYVQDIVERHKVASPDDLWELLEVLSSSIGGASNPQKITNTFHSVKHSDISRDTIANYLDYIIDAFLVSGAQRYDIKGRAYIGSQDKYYFDDLGLRNSILNFRQIEQTHLMENLVYNELVRRGFSVDVGRVTVYGKNKEGKTERRDLEVDFVCNEGYRRWYIQSAWRMDDEDKRTQETESLRRIDDSFRKIIIVGDRQPRYQDENGILYLSLFDFLLDENSLDE